MDELTTVESSVAASTQSNGISAGTTSAEVTTSEVSTLTTDLDAAGLDPAPPTLASSPDQSETDQSSGSSRGRGFGRRIGVAGAFAVLSGTVLTLLWPVLIAPLQADERYQYLLIPGQAKGSVLGAVQAAWDSFHYFLSTARPRLFGYSIMYASETVATDFAVRSGTSIWVVHGLVKATLLGLGLAVAVAFVASLRGRTATGGVLVAPSRRTVGATAVLLVAAVACGVQTAAAGASGWTAYPILTYTSVIVCFGVIALTLVSARRLAERGPRPLLWVVPVLAASALVLNLTFEMYYVAFPAALIALLLVPIAAGGRWSRAKARIVVTVVFSGFFVPVLAVIRLYIKNACAAPGADCYVGSEINTGWGILLTPLYNVISAAPYLNGGQSARELVKYGWQHGEVERFTIPAIVVGALLALALLLLRAWVLTPGHRAAASGTPAASGIPADTSSLAEVHRAEASALLRGLLIALTVGIGCATVMGLSVEAEEIVNGPGQPFRNIVATWVSICLAGAMGVVALDLSWRARAERASRTPSRASWILVWGSAAVVVGVTAAFALPGNLLLARASRASATEQFAEAVQQEVVLADVTPTGRTRRCNLLRAMRDSKVSLYDRNHFANSADYAFQHYAGEAFCLVHIDQADSSKDTK